MKKIAVLMLILVMGVASAQEVAASQAVTTIAVDARPDTLEPCNLSPTFIASIKDAINSQWNLSPYTFSNITNSYCYGNSVSLTLLLKEDESSFTGKNFNINIYSYDTFDYDLIFSERENEALDYSLKQKYIEYLINGTDDEYYASLSPVYDEKNNCDDLRDYYNSLSGEKYFNNDSSWCNIVLKTKTSNIRSLLHSSVSYISYFGEKLRFTFTGYSEGSYDLASIANSIKCDLSKGNYYYPEFETDCYGIYKDKGRIYFSAYTQINDAYVYLNFYGIIGGKAKITASAYGEDISEQAAEEWINGVLSVYLPSQSVDLQENDIETYYTSLSDSKIINGFNFDESLLSDFDSNDYMMDTYYSKGNISVTISEPYIQVNVPLTQQEIADYARIVPPYYWGRTFVITSDRVYSSINLEENNEALAVSNIKDFIDPYITTGDWTLEITVTGNYYWPYLLRGSTLEAAASGQAVSATASQGIVNDALSQQYPAFDELEETAQPTVLELIINFFKGLFGLK